MADDDPKFTTDECEERRNRIRRLQINLPEMLPRAEWPRQLAPRGDPTESDLLFARLFMLDGWPPSGSGDQPPEFPLILLPDVRSPADADYEGFLSAVEWIVEGSLAAKDPKLLDGFSDLGVGGFRDLRSTVRRIDSPLTKYRVWLAICWLIRQLDSTVFTLDYVRSLKRLRSGTQGKKRAEFDRLMRTKELFAEFRALWDLPPHGDDSRKSDDQIDPRSGTSLDNWDLPDDMLWVPESIRRVARVISEIQNDLDFETAKYVEAGLDRMYDEFEAETLGHFEPKKSQTRDPAFVSGVLALESVLRDEIPVAKERRRLIQRILNAAYPDGYRSPRNPLGFHPPTGLWSLRRVEDAARLQPKRKLVTEEEAQRRIADT